MVGQTAGLGVGLTVVVALLWRVFWGPAAMIAGGVFGVIATTIQVVAMTVAGPKIGQGDFRGLVVRWGVGTGLRLVGVVGVAVAVQVAGERFQPLPTALGYLAVLIPLLFFEVRRFR